MVFDISQNGTTISNLMREKDPITGLKVTIEYTDIVGVKHHIIIEPLHTIANVKRPNTVLATEMVGRDGVVFESQRSEHEALSLTVRPRSFI